MKPNFQKHSLSYHNKNNIMIAGGGFIMFEWTKGTSFCPIVTLYANNLTLNSPACTHFVNIHYCMIGIDKEKQVIAIKPVPTKIIEKGQTSFTHLHRVSLGKGYARISNKAVLSEISELMNMPLNGVKCTATFNTKENMLIVDLNDRV